ncbi:amidohydrolase [Jeotgalibacillus alimentarius]|uniref:Amidohydrolase n=1 Tax=Jeotgalibacillus alimentarius TaxID=135826 RepID=A0A0C2VXT7_9BACL|nr:amidohydrolase family protein [Jeotgalibacillus alimentarius]KIL53657.1 amidohydrolase [Jeotgalibacillus alimentarius]
MSLFITNGHVIDVEIGNTYLATIEIEGHKIKRIIQGNESLPHGAETMDAKGQYIIPGLIDMHCHIHERYAHHFTASGVTTIRNTAGNVLLLDKLIESPDDAPTPRIYAADRMIDGSPGLWGDTSYGNFVTDDPQEARAEVQRQAKAGAKFIKLYGWIHQEVMDAAIDEAKKLNLETAIDLINSKNLTVVDAINSGVNWIEHASGAAQELYKGWNPLVDQEPWQHIDWKTHDQDQVNDICRLMLEKNVKLCPTMVLFDQAINFPDIWSPQNEVIESIETLESFMQQWSGNAEHITIIRERTAVVGHLTKIIAKTYYDMGGTVVAGTDTPALLYTYPGMALHRELEIFTEIGFTELEALQAATFHAARSIGMEHIGSIREGNMADLVILKGNPLENIQATRDIQVIIKGGKVYSQKELIASAPGEREVNANLQAFVEKWGESGC